MINFRGIWPALLKRANVVEYNRSKPRTKLKDLNPHAKHLVHDEARNIMERLILLQTNTFREILVYLLMDGFFQFIQYRPNIIK